MFKNVFILVRYGALSLTSVLCIVNDKKMNLVSNLQTENKLLLASHKDFITGCGKLLANQKTMIWYEVGVDLMFKHHNGSHKTTTTTVDNSE